MTWRTIAFLSITTPAAAVWNVWVKMPFGFAGSLP
jgi:hypothetical protein